MSTQEQHALRAMRLCVLCVPAPCVYARRACPASVLLKGEGGSTSPTILTCRGCSPTDYVCHITVSTFIISTQYLLQPHLTQILNYSILPTRTAHLYSTLCSSILIYSYRLICLFKGERGDSQRNNGRKG